MTIPLPTSDAMTGAGNMMTGAGNLIGGNSSANSSANQNVWNPWGEQWQQMMGNAQGVYDQSMGMQAGVQQQAGNAGMFNQGIADSTLQNANSLAQGGAYNQNNPMMQQLQTMFSNTANSPSNMGQMYESIVGGQGNTYVDPVVDDMNRSAQERLNMNRAGNAMDAAGMGQAGGSRHALENAMAQRDINRDVMTNENAMRMGAYDKDMGMKMGIAQQADSNRLQTQQDLMGALNSQNQASQAGLGALNNAQNMGLNMMSPQMLAMQSMWNPMINYANVMGNPIMESSANSSSSSGSGMNSGAGKDIFSAATLGLF